MRDPINDPIARNVVFRPRLPIIANAQVAKTFEEVHKLIFQTSVVIWKISVSHEINRVFSDLLVMVRYSVLLVSYTEWLIRVPAKIFYD